MSCTLVPALLLHPSLFLTWVCVTLSDCAPWQQKHPGYPWIGTTCCKEAFVTEYSATVRIVSSSLTRFNFSDIVTMICVLGVQRKLRGIRCIDRSFLFIYTFILGWVVHIVCDSLCKSHASPFLLWFGWGHGSFCNLSKIVLGIERCTLFYIYSHRDVCPFNLYADYFNF